MEEKRSLFYRVVNSKTSVILYILTLAIFYFGSIIGGMFVANQMLPFDELMVLCGELLAQNLGIFIIYVIFAIIAFFSFLQNFVKHLNNTFHTHFIVNTISVTIRRIINPTKMF